VHVAPDGHRHVTCQHSLDVLRVVWEGSRMQRVGWTGTSTGWCLPMMMMARRFRNGKPLEI
jgi:hypothetical protein